MKTFALQIWILLFTLANVQAQPSTNKRQPAGELRLHPENPHDFVDGGRHVLLESNEGDCLAQPGVEYVVYLRFGGPLRLDTSHSARSLNGRWYNPRTGDWSEAFTVTPSHATHLSCPDDKDWTLHLKAKP